MKLDLLLALPISTAVWSDERIEGLLNDLSGNGTPRRESSYLKVLAKKDEWWKIWDVVLPR